MKSIGGKDIAEFVGISAIVASLIFVGLQLRQDRFVAQSDSLGARQTSELELARLISENGEIWAKGLANEELTTVEEITFEALSTAVFRHREASYRAYGRLGINREFQVRSYAFFLYQHPGLLQKFRQRAAANELRLQAFELQRTPVIFLYLVEEQLRHLEAMSPQILPQNYIPI